LRHPGNTCDQLDLPKKAKVAIRDSIQMSRGGAALVLARFEKYVSEFHG
jgi:hypothetical protein